MFETISATSPDVRINLQTNGFVKRQEAFVGGLGKGF
jgi:hypothetical protein